MQERTSAGLGGISREETAPQSAWRKPAARSQLTTRGGLLGLFALCLAACLIATWRQFDLVAGLGFCAGCVLVSVYVRREGLLKVVLSVPVVFLVAEIATQALTAQGSSTHGSALSVLEGTFLTLADVAPWMFAGTAVCLTIAMCRGLPQCVRELGASLRGESGAVERRRG
jgi:hypothetical protein